MPDQSEVAGLKEQVPPLAAAILSVPGLKSSTTTSLKTIKGA